MSSRGQSSRGRCVASGSKMASKYAVMVSAGNTLDG